MFIFYRDHSSNKTTRWKSVQPGIYLDNKWMQAHFMILKKHFKDHSYRFIYSSIQKFWVGKILKYFKRSLFCSLRLHLYNQKCSKIEKLYYYLK